MTASRVCIIGGFPRAGTRQFADIFNQHPRIEIKGEIYPRSFQSAGELFRQSDKDHLGGRAELKYRRVRIISALNTVAAISKGKNSPFRSDLDVSGFKCPGIERFKSTIDTLFVDPKGQKLKFFFCVRKFQENYLSNKHTFNTPFDTWSLKMVRFIKSFDSICKDTSYDAGVLFLDDFLMAENKGDWIRVNIFNSLGYADITTEECAAYLSATTNRNSTLRVTKAARPNDLDPHDHRLFLASRELRRAAERFGHLTGIDLWNVATSPK